MVSSPHQRPPALEPGSGFDIGSVSALASLDFVGKGMAQGQLSDELEIYLAQRSHFSSTQTLSELLGECIRLQSAERL